MDNLVLDTEFREALRRMSRTGRLLSYSKRVDPELEIAALMKLHDGREALLFEDVKDHDISVAGNVLCCPENCEAALGLSRSEIRHCMTRALANPMEPEWIDDAPVHEVVHLEGIDLASQLPVLRHAPGDGGRFITAGVVIARDPDSGVLNASFHRLHLQGPSQTGVKLDFGRHLRSAYERAVSRGVDLPLVVAIGSDLALQFAAATMGAQMPESADELAAAGGLAGRPLAVTKGLTQDLPVPARTEIVLEGKMRADRTQSEGPFGEFVGFASEEGPSPVFEVTALCHRENPIYHAINGYGRESVTYRKYTMEASLLRALENTVPIVRDVNMTVGGLHRFHAVLQVKKVSSQQDGLQRNAALAAFGTLKDLDMITLVDDDIDLHNPTDVEYAVSTRVEASTDVFVIPMARGHEYIRAGKDGIRSKLVIDATVPFSEKDRFERVKFAPVTFDTSALTRSPLR